MANKILLVSLVVVTLALFFLLLTSDEVYICSDGSEVSNPLDCPVDQAPVIAESRARTNAQTYGQVYGQALDKQFTVVTSFREGSDYKVIGLFSSRTQSVVSEITFLVDGRTGTVSCIEGCDILDSEDIDEDIDEEINQAIENE